MTDAVSLFLSVPPERASAAVAATLSQQGFVVHRGDGVLHVERDAHPVDASSFASRASFRVRVDAAPGGSQVRFDAAEDSPVVVATVRVARARLAEWGLTEPAEAVLALPLPTETAPGGVVPSTADGGGSHEPPAVGDGAATDGSPPAHALARLALVLGFVAPVGGIVTGAFTLWLLRRAPDRGRGLAVAGIIVGAALTIVMAAAVIAGVSWLVVDTRAPSTSVSVASPVPSTAHSPSGAETPVSGFEAEVGQCFVQRGRGEIGEANLVDCAAPHTYELYATFPAAAEADAYPGDAEVARQAEAGCVEAFSGFVGTAYDRSALDYVYLSPTRKTWLAGGRSVSCFVTDPEGTVTGTLRDAAR